MCTGHESGDFRAVATMQRTWNTDGDDEKDQLIDGVQTSDELQMERQRAIQAGMSQLLADLLSSFGSVSLCVEGVLGGCSIITFVWLYLTEPPVPPLVFFAYLAPFMQRLMILLALVALCSVVLKWPPAEADVYVIVSLSSLFALN